MFTETNASGSKSALVSCIVKVYYLSFYGKFNDFLWDSVNITIWTACELNIGIFAASVATLRPLFRTAFQSSTFSTGYTDNEKQQNSLDKNGFVKHISNSRGTSRVGGSKSSNDDFEMFGSVVTANRLGNDNESEETILAKQRPQSMAIRMTTEVTVDETKTRRAAEDRV
jgi:Fungal rhodopsin domain